MSQSLSKWSLVSSPMRRDMYSLKMARRSRLRDRDQKERKRNKKKEKERKKDGKDRKKKEKMLLGCLKEI